MKILITGNLGYVGPALVRELRTYHPDAFLIGYDIGYFSRIHTTNALSPECFLDVQHYGDVRNFPERLLEGVDAVIQLAAISNDPIGNRFEEVTLDINYRAAINIAEKAKRQGVKRMLYASSCSVYGAAEDAPRKENAELNPLTAYAKSKIFTERDLEPLSSEDFQVICFRFATACGWSDRMRLDLVLNDFVAGAMTSNKITILSDGTPWRPLINVNDMARVLRWGCEWENSNSKSFTVMNAGSNSWNYQVKELAFAVKEIMPQVDISINQNAEPDKRSYRVNFDRFAELAPGHQPQYDLAASVRELQEGLKKIDFQDANFHQSQLIRLNVIKRLRELGALDNQLRIVQPQKRELSLGTF